MREPRILLFDLETAPNDAWIWGLWYETRSMEFVKSDWYVLCWSAKWLGSDEILSEGLYSKGKNDKKIMIKLAKLIDEADIIIAHNAVKFDCKKANTRFIINRIKPPSPCKVIDTLIIARQKFAFASNKLGDLGKFLGVGTKKATGGFKLWKKCMDGNKKAWKTMIKYCKQDVTLLEKVYLKIRPYMTNHPNLSVIQDEAVCPKCGSPDVWFRGYYLTSARTYRRFSCKKCTGWGRVVKCESHNKTYRSI